MIRRTTWKRMPNLLSLGQYLVTLKCDSYAELAFPQFFFYSKNLPKTPHPLSLRLLHSGQCK